MVSSTLIVYFLTIGVLLPPIVISLLSCGLTSFDANLSFSAFPHFAFFFFFFFALLAVFAFSPFRIFIFPVSLFRLFLRFSCLFIRYCRLRHYASAKNN